MVAQEWDAQDTVIDKHGMHLTALCNTAVDMPTVEHRLEHATGLLKFLETDTVCFFEEIPVDLHDMQKEEWAPLVEWFSERHGVAVPTTTTLVNSVPAEALEAAKAHVLGLSDWGATGLDFAIQVRHAFYSSQNGPP